MYVQVDENYYNHPKTELLVRAIGKEADVYPIRLWCFCLKYARTGILKQPGHVEVACRWDGPPGKLLEAMKQAGFIEDDGVTLSGWMEYTGAGIAMYERRKEDAKEARRLYRQHKEAERKKYAASTLPADHRKILVDEPPKDEDAPFTGQREETPPKRKIVDIQSPEDQNSYRLFQLARKVIQGRDDTVRQYLDKWISAKGAAYVEQVLMDPKAKGQSVVGIQKFFFETLATGAQGGGFLG